MPSKKIQLLDYLVSFAALVFCVFRLFYGCDLTDEGYYIALPWRFVLGDRPFIDEAYILQTASLPLIPLVKLFTFFSGGTEGIILFTRFTYLLFSFAIALVTWSTIKIKWPKFPLTACLILAVFIPYNTPNLSYNTLGRGFFTLGLMFGLIRLYLEKASPYLFLAGVLHGLAVFSYPTLGLGIFAFFVLLLFAIPQNKVRLSFIYLGGCLFPILCIYFLLDAKLDDYIHSFNFTRSAVIKAQNSGIDIVINTLTHAARAFPSPFVLLSTLIAFILVSKISKKTVLIPLVISFIAIILRAARPTLGGAGANGTITYLGLLSPLLFLGLKSNTAIKNYFLLVFIPSLVGALAMACTSGNGWNASALLLVNGVVFGSILIYERLLHYKDSIVIVFSVIILAVIMRYELSAMPDGSRQDMTMRLTHGPYLGIFTSPEKAAYYDELSQLLLKHENKNGRLLVIPHLPAAYLFSNMRPASLNIWGGCSKEAPMDCQKYYKEVYSKDNKTLKVKKLLMSKNVEIDFSNDVNPLDKLILETQKVIDETAHFVVLGSSQ